MYQDKEKERNRFIYSLLLNIIGANKFKMHKTNIQGELDLGTKCRYLTNGTLESLNTLPVAEQQSWLFSDSVERDNERPKYK